MIFIQPEYALGSKRFTLALAEALRHHLPSFLSEEEMDDFEGDLLQVMIHFGYWHQDSFMKTFQLIESLPLESFQEEKMELLEAMKQDHRFSHR